MAEESTKDRMAWLEAMGTLLLDFERLAQKTKINSIEMTNMKQMGVCEWVHWEVEQGDERCCYIGRSAKK